MKNDWTLEDYQIIQNEKDKSWLCLVVLFLTMIGIIVVIYRFKFQVYEKQTLIKSDDEFLLVVDSRKISEIESNPYIYINHKKYRYAIEMISKDYTNINNDIYQTIHINPYNYNTDSIVTECYFLKSENSILEMIIKFIKGGIG